jgi:hypothetical protein
MASTVTGSKGGTASFFNKNMRGLGLKNELIHYHCIIQQTNLIGKTPEFRKIITNANTVNSIRSRGLTT